MASKKISLSVTDFALPAPRKGSIEAYSGFSRGQEDGLEIHQRVQAERIKSDPQYKSEVIIKQCFDRDGFTFEVGGRMDGYWETDKPKIEEIKSSFNIFELLKRIKEAPTDHPYCLQLLTYGYFHWLQKNKIPELNLHLVSSRNGDTHDWNVPLNISLYENWLDLRLDELVEEAKRAEKRAKRRKKAAGVFQFPFANPRSSQLELIATIEEGMKENRRMLIQAPTGLGKTIGVLYPTLKEALARGQRVVYVTPKNSQHGVAEDAIDRMQGTGAPIKAMTLTAKSKMCFKNEPICNPEFCEYAKDHYTKVAEHKVMEQLSKKKSLTAKVFKKIAEEFQVCPFEIQVDAVQEADAVICDYNYVFAPRSVLGRLSGMALDQEGKPNLVIDEAHNLPSRAMDYYSPSLSVFALEKMRDEIRALPIRFRDDAEILLDGCIDVVKNCAPKNCDKPCLIKPPTSHFLVQDENLRMFVSTYLKSDVDIAPKDVVLRLSFYWSEFTSALEHVTRDEFFTTFSPNPASVRITCCDASAMLQQSYDSYEQVVGFSATLKPFDYYSQLSGLTSTDLKTAEFVSPFPKNNRKLLIIPQISSKFSQRQQNYPKIADAIEKISALKKGNYFAFFPSFDFMEKVLNEFRAPKDTIVLRQERYMRRDSIDEVLQALSQKDLAHIVFAVQGGVFSEGVDYPGDMVIGAFVVGPPLPNFDLEREQMREYYQENYAAGFDYAYTYPAMAKAVQAAGRVIRSETDRGIIVLMDDRFVQSSYSKSMPQDWFETSARELVSQQILKDVADFWNETLKIETDLLKPIPAEI
ncbi:MAG: ATP-dependent DNA helicase [Bdellovibrionota bacterium]